MYLCSARRVRFQIDQIQISQFEKKSVMQNMNTSIYTPPPQLTFYSYVFDHSKYTVNIILHNCILHKDHLL